MSRVAIILAKGREVLGYQARATQRPVTQCGEDVGVANAHRDALIHEIRPACDVWCESAAVRELDGCLNRYDAERGAYVDIIEREAAAC